MMNKELKYPIVLQVLNQNTLHGPIEIGYRYWVAQHLTVKYSDSDELKQAARWMNKLWEFTTLSTIPSEKSDHELMDRKRELAKHYVAVSKNHPFDTL